MRWSKSDNGERAAPPEFSALIDEGTEIEGKFSFSGVVMLNARIRGEIVSSDSLIIGEKGVVNATINSRVVRIAGEVTGDVHATERVELAPSARVFGDIEAPAVIVAEGALFEGQCRMSSARPGEQQHQAPHHQTPARDLTVVPFKRTEAQR